MRAILFDVNGTLLDSREHIFWQYEQLTREFDGAPATRHEISSAMHGTADDVLHTLVKNPHVSFKTLQKRHDDLQQEALKRMKLFNGVDELLPILRRIGFRMAAVSSGDHRIAEALDQTDIRHYFDIVVTDAHVLNPKPHPEGMLYALKHLGIEPAQAIVVGDTQADIIAGKQAGVAKTIGVLHGFGSPDMLRSAKADHLIEDIPSLLDVIE
jgi:pyrophosphatase PpaX